MPAGTEITVPRALTPDPGAGLWKYELTFDGGARSVFGSPKVAGAGITLWRHAADGCAPTLLVSVTLALPDLDDSQVAEAIGCRIGLALLVRVCPHASTARVVGDNLAVIRYGAGTGRFRRPALQAQMEQGLGPLATRGWSLSWQAVRRRLNIGSDRLATLGVFWAQALHARRLRGMRIHEHWHEDPAPADPRHFPTLPDPGDGLAPGRVALGAAALEEAARSFRTS